MCYLKSAKVVNDVEFGIDYVEIEYTKFVPGNNQYEVFKDYFNTKPLGSWNQILCMKQNVAVDKFLDTMVEKNVEVLQKMADIAVEHSTPHFRLMHASKILDPTFQPPYINPSSYWQKNFVKDFCKETIPEIIYNCTNAHRLEKFFNVAKLIQLEL